MVRFTKAISGNTDLLTAQAYIFQTPNINLAFLITASGEDIFTKVRFTASTIEEKFFMMQEPISTRLEGSLKLLKEQLRSINELEVLLAAWQENVLYICNSGNHQAFLLRDNQLTNLIPESSEDQLISGHLKIGDKILFITNSFSKVNDLNIIEKLTKTPTDSFEEELNIQNTSQTESSENTEPSILPRSKPIAAILLDYHSDQLDKPLPSFDQATSKSRLRPSLSFKLPSFIPRNKKLLLIPLLLLLIIGATFLYFSSKNKTLAPKTDQQASLISSAKDKLAQAQTLKDADPKAAKQNLDEAKKSIVEALSTNPNNSEAKDLKKQIDDATPSILKINTVSNFPVYLSLDLLKSGFTAKKISDSLGKILLLDDTKKTLVLVNLKAKTNQILAGSDKVGQAEFASLNGDYAFTFSSDKGIVRTDTKNQKSTQVVKPDSDWGKINDIYAFGGNVYLLDILKNQIWKYVPAASGYSDKNPYFKDTKAVALADAKRLEIDSSVWVLKSSNEIKKYLQGIEDNFTFTGLDKDLSSVNSFYVSDTTDNFYLLDSGNSRVVILDKKGQYITQYQGDKFKTADDLLVDEKDKKIYLLEGNKLYTVDLQ